MGFLKKLTRPISKVLDKIVPNEIKPALPFLSAAVPFLAPTAGIFGTMAGRAALSGGANILAQLSQEGSEGDFSGLSALLAAGTGALSAPGGGADPLNPVNEFGTKGVVSQPSAADFFSGKAAGMDPGFTKSGLEALGKGSEYLSGVGETLRTNPFSPEGIKASIVPVTQATTDLAVAEGRRLEKQAAIDEALAAAEGLADDADRALAIRQFMEAAGYFSEDEIVDTITAAGYANGGRVGFDNGGDLVIDTLRILPDTLDKISEKIAPFLGYDNLDELKIKNNPNLKNDEDPDFSGIKGAVEGVDKNMRADRAGDFFRLREEAIQKGDDDKIKEIESDFFKEFGMVMPKMAKNGGRINFDEGGISLDEQQMEIIKGGGPKIVGLLADADKMMGTEGDRLDMALKMLLRDNEDNELLKYMLDTAEERGTTKLDVLMDLIRSQRISDISAFDRGKKSLKDDISVKDLARKEGSMKDGGLMDLGGKEMDLRKGGFVPIGKKERADDVPARLSKNEFVMTADAVRGAGGGDINKGAKRMYETMNRLEARA